MKALSIKNPWGYLIASGIKDVENRSWRTNYRGRIYIHTSAQPDNRRVSDLFTLCQFNAMKEEMQRRMVFKLYPNSAIIGEVDIVDCIPDSISIWAEQACWNWLLENPVLYDTPIVNVKGKLSLWEWSPPSG